MKALQDAMEDRGWSVYETSRRTGIAKQGLRNLLQEGATRPTIPASITAHTMVRLLETFPTLDISDFIAGATLSVRESSRGQA